MAASEGIDAAYGRCVTCRHWEEDTRREVLETYGGRAIRWRDVPTDSGEGECARMGSENGKPEDAESLAWSHDAEGYSAGVTTRAEFGCVMHKERLQ